MLELVNFQVSLGFLGKVIVFSHLTPSVLHSPRAYIFFLSIDSLKRNRNVSKFIPLCFSSLSFIAFLPRLPGIPVSFVNSASSSFLRLLFSAFRKLALFFVKSR